MDRPRRPGKAAGPIIVHLPPGTAQAAVGALAQDDDLPCRPGTGSAIGFVSESKEAPPPPLPWRAAGCGRGTGGATCRTAGGTAWSGAEHGGARLIRRHLYGLARGALRLAMARVPRRHRFAVSLLVARAATPFARRAGMFTGRRRWPLNSALTVSLHVVLGELLRGGIGFDARVFLAGLENLDAAAADGRGVLLIGPHTVLTRMAVRHLHERGYPGPSRPRVGDTTKGSPHGYSNSTQSAKRTEGSPQSKQRVYLCELSFPLCVLCVGAVPLPCTETGKIGCIRSGREPHEHRIRSARSTRGASSSSTPQTFGPRRLGRQRGPIVVIYRLELLRPARRARSGR